MPDLPTGTITFLFTDVEGSSGPWDEHPVAMRQAMARHDVLLTAVFAQHDGIVVRPRGEGDSLFAVFIRATDAVAAALAGQRALQAEDWGEVGPLRVRMALLTGEADLREGDYYGSAVNRCARIRSAGYGGQILLAQTTERLVRTQLPPGASLRSLGVHRLRGQREPETIYQLEAPDLPTRFPPLKTLDARPNNLPLQLTSFIGREQELADVTNLVREARLVTLTGPGGAGKTRLAQEVAAAALDDYPDGVFFVDLAPLHDPEHVPAALAHVLSMRESPDWPLTETLRVFVQERTLLLVLDNCEHLLPAASFIATLLADSPGLRVLATSREPLGLRGERQYPVPPLPLPDRAASDVAAAARSAAVTLFVARAQTVRPDFALTAENVAAVVAICARLDGLPLAIELAAARVRVLPPPALLARLDQRLALLAGGARDLPARQQTLRNALAWSHDLLTAAEQRLFRRLAVFVGGCTLEAVAAVCTAQQDLGLEALDGITALVDRSLVRQEPDDDQTQTEPRFSMMETVREYAHECLAAAGEGDALGRHHAEFYVAFADRAGAELRGPAQPHELRRLSRDYENLRAALSWCAQHGEAELELRLAVALSLLWRTLGQMSDGARALERAVAIAHAVPPALRARVLLVAGAFAESRHELDAALTHLEESLRLYRALADQAGIAAALAALGDVVEARGDFPRAVALLEESLALRRQLGDVAGMPSVLLHLGSAVQSGGDLAQAETILGEALAISQTLGDHGRIAQALTALGVLAQQRRQLDEAAKLYYEAEAHFRALGYLRGLARVLQLEGVLQSQQGDKHGAAARLRESLALGRQAEDLPLLAWGLSCLAVVCAADGPAAHTARLFGAAAAAREAHGLMLDAAFQRRWMRAEARVRAALGAATFAAAVAAGRSLTLAQAVAEALAVSIDRQDPRQSREPTELPETATAAPPGPLVALSPREGAVLRLLAAGKSNREIAETLVLSIRTVETHIARIHAKIGAKNRTEAATYAVRHGLVE